MRVFNLPQFNLHCDIYRGTLAGQAGALAASTVPCQLYSRPELAAIVLRCPKGTDIRPGILNQTSTDWINVPSGSHNWYTCNGPMDVHRGFPNEYVATFLFLQSPPTTYPRD